MQLLKEMEFFNAKNPLTSEIFQIPQEFHLRFSFFAATRKQLLFLRLKMLGALFEDPLNFSSKMGWAMLLHLKGGVFMGNANKTSYYKYLNCHSGFLKRSLKSHQTRSTETHLKSD